MILRSKILTLAIITATVAPCASHAGEKAESVIFKAWGNPSYVSNLWNKGWLDKTYWVKPKKAAANAGDEAIAMVYAARKLVVHGGYFCLVQPRSRNKGTKTLTKVWTQYIRPDGNVDATCFWLCEPGYTGEDCKSGAAKNASECKNTRLSAENLAKDISYHESGDWDSNSVESNMKRSGGFLWYEAKKSNKTEESDMIVAAKSFLENGHGIVASVAQVTAHCGFWTLDDYSDAYTSCDKGNSDITISSKGGDFATKTLCMQGFDGPNCSTTVCRECEDKTHKYNDATGQCSDCIENYHKTSAGECIKCGENEIFDKNADECVACPNTEYPKDNECVPREQIGKQRLYDCWPNTDATEFAICVKDTCTDDTSVKCMAGQGRIGKKTCKDKKWGKCEELKN